MEWWEKTPKVILGDYESIFGLSDEITRREVKFLLDEVSIDTRAAILDLCCGTGRHSIELAKLGYAVTGLDISEELLMIAKQKALNANVEVRFIQEDMRNIPDKNSFDLVFIMFGAWGYFNEDDQKLSVLFQVYEALRKDGHFVLDFFNHDWIVKNFQPYYWSKMEDGFLLEKRQLDLINGRHNSLSYFIKPNGDFIEWETSVRGYTLAEILSMLDKANFTVCNIYGGINREPYSLESPRLLVHSKK